MAKKPKLANVTDLSRCSEETGRLSYYADDQNRAVGHNKGLQTGSQCTIGVLRELEIQNTALDHDKGLYKPAEGTGGVLRGLEDKESSARKNKSTRDEAKAEQRAAKSGRGTKKGSTA